MNNNIIIKNASQLVTCSGNSAKHGQEMQDLKVIEEGCLVIVDGKIAAVGHEDVLKNYNENEFVVIDASGKAVLPGFVDSHTHFIFGGYREEEFNWRLRGDSYMDIMQRGGGIANTVRDTRKASLKDLKALGLKRLKSMLSFGVTTVEGKSGYGLDYDTELRQLKAMEELKEEQPIDIVATFLGAHAIPSEYKGREEEYIDFICDKVLPEVAKHSLAEFCDVFCEKNVFSIEQSRRLLKKAQQMGFKLKLHADEIVRLGGAELAAELGATSADHLLQASPIGIRALAEKNVVATLLPCTAFSLREHYAPGREMIDSGCAVALATDFNPGSCYTESIPLLLALACLQMKLTIEEAITAITINGAAALNRAEEIGSLDVGKKGDVVILEYPSYKFLPYHLGVSIVEQVIKEGKVVFNKQQ